MAQVIKQPMATNTTGKNHLSRNFCTRTTSLSAGDAARMVKKGNKAGPFNLIRKK